MRLDHVSYAATRDELLDVVRRLGSALGGNFADGGRHPRFGTTNYVFPLAGGTYVEVVAALDHPSSERAPFGQAVRQRAEAGGGWLGWAVAVDDLAPVEQRLGRDAVDGNRQRPDGKELRWRQLGVRALIDDPQLPFFTQWLIDPADHPSGGAGPSRLAALELAGKPATLTSWLGEPTLDALDGVDLRWVEADEPGLVAVHVDTPRGLVRLD